MYIGASFAHYLKMASPEPEVTRCQSQGENGTLAKDTIMGTRNYIEKIQPWT